MKKRGIYLILILAMLLLVLPLVYSQGNGIAAGKNPDFDGNGIVGISDYFMFADSYGAEVTDANNRFDLNSDNNINMDDFFLFADEFGKEVEEEKYLKFTFQNWNDEEVIALINYLCGSGDWVLREEVYNCNSDNGNEMDGAYEIALDIFGEPFMDIPSIAIIKDNTIDANGMNSGDTIWLNTAGISGISIASGIEMAKSTLAHELLHSFRGNLRFSIYEEGQVEAASIIIKLKMGQRLDSTNVLSYYDTYNKETIRTKNGYYFYGFSDIASIQYQLAANVWLELYANNKDFFKMFNDEIRKPENEDYLESINGLNQIVKRIMPTLNGKNIDLWFARNHILSTDQDESTVLYIYGPTPDITILDRKGPGGQPMNLRDAKVNIKYFDWNNNFVSEEVDIGRFVYGFFSEAYWLTLNSPTIPGRYVVIATAEKDGKEYSASSLTGYWLDYDGTTRWGGIMGIVTPYLEGRVTVTTEDDRQIVFDVRNGGFGDKGGLNTYQLRGRLKFEFESPDGEKITRYFYKTVWNLFVILNDEPIIVPEIDLYAEVRTPFEIKAKIYGSEENYVNYRYNSIGNFLQIPMSQSGDYFIATIPNNQDGINFIEYYISSFRNRRTTIYPDNGIENPLKTYVLSASVEQVLIGGEVRILRHNLPLDSLVGYLHNGGSGALYLSNRIHNANLREPQPLILFFSRADFESGELTLGYQDEGINQEIRVYYPDINSAKYDDWNDHFLLYVTDDGSTYWKKNDDLGIENPTFEDAIRNGNLARVAPSRPLTFDEGLELLEATL